VSKIYYELWLLCNLENNRVGGGELLIGRYESDPNLAVGDKVNIKDWKIKVSTDTDVYNEPFSFSAEVLEIQKIITASNAFVVKVSLESPDRETVAKMSKAFREGNPDKFSS